jgi:hypothetical protein
MRQSQAKPSRSCGSIPRATVSVKDLFKCSYNVSGCRFDATFDDITATNVALETVGVRCCKSRTVFSDASCIFQIIQVSVFASFKTL